MSRKRKFFVSGATGQLGRLVLDALLEAVPAETIVAGVRDPASASALAIQEQGIEIRVADYARPETLSSALQGIERLLLISGNEIGQRTAQHRNVIAAAKDTGVGLIAYTSILHADTSPLFLATEHLETEAALKDSGLPFVLLRNGWYNEVFTWRIPSALQHGIFMGASEDGRTSSAARADYAKAAAIVLAGGDEYAGQTFELAGDTSFTLRDLVTLMAETSGKQVVYQNMTAGDFYEALLAAGVPNLFARIMSDTDQGVAKGALFEDAGHLSRLIGRSTTPLRDTVVAFLASVADTPEPGHI